MLSVKLLGNEVPHCELYELFWFPDFRAVWYFEKTCLHCDDWIGVTSYVYADMPLLSVHVQSPMQLHSCSYSLCIIRCVRNSKFHISLLRYSQAVMVKQVCHLHLYVCLPRQLRLSIGPADAWMCGPLVKLIFYYYHNNINIIQLIF